MIFDKVLEDAIGLFELALSFAGDATAEASQLSDFARFHNVRCYHYQEHLVRQSGVNIRTVMRHVYLTARNIVIFNSPLYGRTPNTRFERDLIGAAAPPGRILIVECGGVALGLSPPDLVSFDGFSNEIALAILDTVRRPRNRPAG